MTDQRIWPGIKQQTLWRCNFFDFGKQPNYAFFNPGLVERPDGLWLIARRSKNERRIRIGFNDIVAAQLEEHTYRVKGFVPIMTQRYFDREHFEDPRAIQHNGTTYISACNFVIVNNGAGWTGAHQTMNAIAPTGPKVDRWQVAQRHDPVFGYNGHKIGKDTGLEKNWLWFFRKGYPHLVYKAVPHTVAIFTPEFKFLEELKTETPLEWHYGTVRGGTPPVNAFGEYVTFFHSSIPIELPYGRRYYMGAYAFESKPPFAITRYTPEPLLVGSHQDMWAKGKPLVVFPCGSRLKDEKWLVTMGVNDLLSAWIEIPHADLLSRMVPVHEPKKSLASVLVDKLVQKGKDAVNVVG